MSLFVIGCIAVTSFICLFIARQAKLNADKNIIDNSAQHVKTVGVGIIFLLNAILKLSNFARQNKKILCLQYF